MLGVTVFASYQYDIAIIMKCYFYSIGSEGEEIICSSIFDV